MYYDRVLVDGFLVFVSFSNKFDEADPWLRHANLRPVLKVILTNVAQTTSLKID